MGAMPTSPPRAENGRSRFQTGEADLLAEAQATAAH
jgi:hypothetical protein